MKKRNLQKERQLELCDLVTRIEVVIHSLAVLGGKVNELLRRTRRSAHSEVENRNKPK